MSDLQPPSPGRRAALVAAVASFFLHALALLVAWQSWTTLGRRNVVTWIDLPVSLLYLGRSPRAMVLWSAFCGGLQWALIGAVLAYIVGRSARRPVRS